jgi:hypothetical protein
MRKLWLAGPAAALALTVAAIALTVAAIAVAQETVTNTYDVEGSTSPARAGSRQNPVPIAINFDYSVGEVQNRHPAVVKKFSIRYGGTQVNPNVAPGCSRSELEEERSVDGCPRRSIVGNGFIEFNLTERDNPRGPSTYCNARLWIVNQGDRKANIFVKGSPDAPRDSPEHCPFELADAIPAQFVRRGSATALEFEVPDSLSHPIPTLSNAVKRVRSRVRRITRRIRGKRRGYFEAIGGCRNNRRLITVVFTPEDGPTETERDRAPCR